MNPTDVSKPKATYAEVKMERMRSEKVVSLSAWRELEARKADAERLRARREELPWIS